RLIAELRDTPYGDFEVYYTGADPRWLAAQTARYRFFGRRRGYVSDEDLTGASPVWAADFDSMSGCAASARVSADRGVLTVSGVGDSTRTASQTICEAPLKKGAIYQIDADMMFRAGQWALRIVDATAGEWIYERKLGSASSPFDNLFRLA